MIGLREFREHGKNDVIVTIDVGRRGIEVVPVIVITALNYLYVGECIKRLCQMGIRRFMVNRYNIEGRD